MGRFCQRSVSGGEQMGFGDGGDGLTGVDGEGEEGAHEAGQDGDGEALAEGEGLLAGLDGRIGADLMFLGVSGGAVDGDCDGADEDAEQGDLSGVGVGDGHDLAVVDGRNEGAEDHAEAEGDGVSEGEAEVADGQAEGETTDAPERAEEDGVGDGMVGGVGVGLGDDGPHIGDEDAGQQGGRDDPCGEALDDPVDLPGPALDLAEGDEVGGGGEASDQVVDDSDERIGNHGASLLLEVELGEECGRFRRNSKAVPSYLRRLRCGKKTPD